jgi:hypothetical protein
MSEQQPKAPKSNKRMTMLKALEAGRKSNESRLTWEEVMACGLYVGLLYGEIGGCLQFSYPPDCEGADQYLMQFAGELENRVRAKVANATKVEA